MTKLYNLIIEQIKLIQFFSQINAENPVVSLIAFNESFIIF